MPGHELELRYDGPIPAVARVDARARSRLFNRLASEARHSTAFRRAELTAPRVLADRRLHELASDLGYFRRAGVRWAVLAR